MPDEDRVVAAIMDLMNQVSRVAWALEAVVLNKHGFECDPCRRCGSQMVPVLEEACPACLEPKKEKTDG